MQYVKINSATSVTDSVEFVQHTTLQICKYLSPLHKFQNVCNCTHYDLYTPSLISIHQQSYLTNSDYNIWRLVTTEIKCCKPETDQHKQTGNPRWLQAFAGGAKNGYELYNPIFVFLISYKFTALNMKIMFGKLK